MWDCVRFQNFHFHVVWYENSLILSWSGGWDRLGSLIRGLNPFRSVLCEIVWDFRIFMSPGTKIPWSYPCIGGHTIWHTIFQNIQKGRILDGFDPPSTRFWSQTTCNKVKLSISAKTDQRSSKSDKTLDSVGQNISIQNLGFSWKILSRQMGLLRSFLVVQSRMRTLYLHQTPSARNASVSSRYSGLWDRF